MKYIKLSRTRTLPDAVSFFGNRINILPAFRVSARFVAQAASRVPGGALIVPPALTAFFGVRQVEGQGLGLALVAPGSVIALVAYAGAGQVDWRLGIPLAVGGVVAISAGVAFAHSLPERRLRFAFCGLLVLIAALLELHG
jgi:uncharacterized membrane protein YfcA